MGIGEHSLSEDVECSGTEFRTEKVPQLSPMKKQETVFVTVGTYADSWKSLTEDSYPNSASHVSGKPGQ